MKLTTGKECYILTMCNF